MQWSINIAVKTIIEFIITNMNNKNQQKTIENNFKLHYNIDKDNKYK